MTSNDLPKMKRGDRVYTYKRGFGQIIRCSTIRNRPWIISFDSCPDKAFWPKEKNILPEYAGKFIEEIDRKCLEELLKWRESDEETYCKPKIKVGDLVFYDGLYAHHGIKKWVCAGRKFGCYHEPDTYELKEAGPHGSVVINIPTSEVLRPWKETKFTAFVGIHEPSTLKVGGLCDGNLTPNDYKQVVYLGKNAIGIDTFSCTTFDGCITILFGEKGDDL